ncbi:alpha-L-rhamnosidase-related protein [Yinghuangia aomiensis]
MAPPRWLSRISTLTGHPGDAERFARLADGALRAWRAEYLAADGTMSPDTQATYVRALAFGLVPDELRDAAVDRLVALIREAGTHVGTGFLATPYLLPVLADTGHLDLAFDLLFRDTEPSWLTMIDRGATTIWEEWHGIDAEGKAHASLNHYSKGAVISFLHTHVAGIRPPAEAGPGLGGLPPLHDRAASRRRTHLRGSAVRVPVRGDRVGVAPRRRRLCPRRHGPRGDGSRHPPSGRAQAGRRAREPHLPMSLPRRRAADAARRARIRTLSVGAAAPENRYPTATSGRAGP